MKIKVVVLALICMMLVGCSKEDYGIFTKEGYKDSTEETRNRIFSSYEVVREFVYNVNEKKYDKLSNHGYIINENMKNIELYTELGFVGIINSVIDISTTNDEAWDKYIDSLDAIRPYIEKENVDELVIEKDLFNSARNYFKDLHS